MQRTVLFCPYHLNQKPHSPKKKALREHIIKIAVLSIGVSLNEVLKYIRPYFYFYLTTSKYASGCLLYSLTTGLTSCCRFKIKIALQDKRCRNGIDLCAALFAVVSGF